MFYSIVEYFYNSCFMHDWAGSRNELLFQYKVSYSLSHRNIAIVSISISKWLKLDVALQVKLC